MAQKWQIAQYSYSEARRKTNLIVPLLVTNFFNGTALLHCLFHLLDKCLVYFLLLYLVGRMRMLMCIIRPPCLSLDDRK